MFASSSQDRGKHFEPNIDLGTPLFEGNQGDLFSLQAVGEFNSLVARNGGIYAAWTDTRTHDPGAYLAVGHCRP
jgi:hypothetical protein